MIKHTAKQGRILVVDDDADFVRDVATALESRGYSVRSAGSVAEARSRLAEFTDELVLLDLLLPGTNGRVLCCEIAETTQAGIIVISAVDDDAERIALLDFGADDYIVKPFNMLELQARIRAYFRRSGKRPNRHSLRFGPWRLHEQERHLLHDDGRLVTLTSSEAQVMRLFTSNPEIVFDREDLLAVSRIRQHVGRNDRSIDNLIKRLRKKIETDPGQPIHLQTVWGRGYVFNL
ncbi:MAG: response regulator transcription factor [Sedimentitalea sp.]|uniref:response regulator transcription factor n=1 Tax=Sedimentitalea sp. TaxID=2048915 RepID=UPI003262E7DD